MTPTRERAALARFVSHATLLLAGAVGAKALGAAIAGRPLDARTLALGLALGALGALVGRLGGARRRRAPGAKPVLAVDLDEVCCHYLPAFVRFMNAERGTRLAEDCSDFDSYMFWEVPATKLATREAATDAVYAFHASKHFRAIAPVTGAKEALRVLGERFELHVVTSRQTDIEAATRAWVAAHLPGVFAELHFGNHFGRGGARVSKPDMCAAIGACGLIDDSPAYAAQCAAAGIPAFLFGDYGWNRAAKLDAAVTRVAHWRMVAQLVTPAFCAALGGEV